nr:hypothetical protein [Micromonospora rhizosphaerae]
MAILTALDTEIAALEGHELAGRDDAASLRLAGDPVDRRVEVGPGVLAGAEVVPVPGRPAVVVRADLVELEPRGLAEVVGQLNCRCIGAQRHGEVDDLDGTGASAATRADRIGIGNLLGSCRRSMTSGYGAHL